jgi:hypothetical protein
MINKQRYMTFALLLSATLFLSVFIPGYLRAQAETELSEEQAELTSPVVEAPAAPVEEDVESTIVEEDELLANCTYPLGYWQSRTEAWPAQIILAGSILEKEDAREVFAASNPDVQTRLIQQVYTAFLNVLNGANVQSIESTLLEAAAWLDDNPPEEQLSELNRRQGRYMADVIEHYNLGKIGPGACPDAPLEMVALPEPTEAPAPTDPPSMAAAQNQPQQSRPAAPVAAPTQEEREELPAPPPPPPTEPPPPPPPTDPPPPPTEAPPPPSPTDPPPPPPPPTEAPPPPPEQNQNALKLANEYGVSYDEIIGWLNQGFGVGEVSHAYDLSRETGEPVDKIFQMRKSGMGWGQIKQALKP